MNKTEVGVSTFPFLQEKRGWKTRQIDGWSLVRPKKPNRPEKFSQENYWYRHMLSQRSCEAWTDWTLDEEGFAFFMQFYVYSRVPN